MSSPLFEYSQVPLLLTSPEGKTLSVTVNAKDPLTTISRMIEEQFHICPSSQVILYNGSLVNLNLSLTQNGALLLKGEPFVRLNVQVAKGSVVALNFILPTRQEIPLSVSENTSFAAIKKLLCDEVPGIHPKDVRLYGKGNELMDSATPRYYRLNNGTKITVTKQLNITQQRESLVFAELQGAAKIPATTLREHFSAPKPSSAKTKSAQVRRNARPEPLLEVARSTGTVNHGVDQVRKIVDAKKGTQSKPTPMHRDESNRISHSDALQHIAELERSLEVYRGFVRRLLAMRSR